MPPVQQQRKSVDELTVDEARVELALSQTAYATDDNFEILLADTLSRVEAGQRAQRDALAVRISELEAKVNPPAPSA